MPLDYFNKKTEAVAYKNRLVKLKKYTIGSVKYIKSVGQWRVSWNHK